MAEHVAGTYPSGSRAAYGTSPAEAVDVRFSRKRISWGAVLAGVIIVLVVQLLLSLLGLGVGASTIDPTGETPAASTLGIGAGVWWVVSALIAVLAGSWVAGRLAGSPERSDGMLHGLVTWGLSTLLVMWMLTTTLSSLIGGAFGVVGSALQTAGQGAVAGATAGMAQAGRSGDPLAQIEQQVDRVLSRVSPEAQQARQQLEQAISDDRVRETVQRVITAGPDAVTPQDRETAINGLVQYGGMSRPEAERRLAEWEAGYRETEQQAREAAEASADAVSQGALWSFVALALGAAVAAFGGMLGAPRDTVVETHRRI